MIPDVSVPIVLLSIWALAVVSRHVSPIVGRVRSVVVSLVDSPEPSPVEQIQQEWVDGKIDQDELERRLEFALNDDREVVVAELTPIDHVGERRAKRLAREFSTVEAVRSSDREELLEVDDVGPETAAAVESHFN